MWKRSIAADRGSAEDYIKIQLSNTHKIVLDHSKLQQVFAVGSDRPPAFLKDMFLLLKQHRRALLRNLLSLSKLVL